MKYIILATFSLLSFGLIVSGQIKNASKNNNPIFIIDVNKPSVYLTFEKLGGNSPLIKSDLDDQERISLRLRNNTVFSIAVEANFEINKIKESSVNLFDGGKGDALPDGAEVEVCYESETIPDQISIVYEDRNKDKSLKENNIAKVEPPKQTALYYSCKQQTKRRGRGNVWIPSGSSIIFSVPRKFLGKDLKIYTLFNYEWESTMGQMKADEPKHQIFYYWNDLPYSLRQK